MADLGRHHALGAKVSYLDDVAGSAVLIGLVGALGGWAGGYAADTLAFLRDSPLVWGPITFNNCHATFAISLVARAASLVWLVGLPDPASRRVRDLVRHMRTTLYYSVASWLVFPLRALGWLRPRNRRPRKADRTPPGPNGDE